MRAILLFSALILSGTAFAQHEGMQMPTPPQQQKTPDKKPKEQMPAMPGMQMDMSKTGTDSLVEQTLQHSTAGTSAQPDSTAAHMMMWERGNWKLMFHGNGFVVDEQQSGPR